jgi:hypothetical protein
MKASSELELIGSADVCTALSLDMATNELNRVNAAGAQLADESLS